MHNMLKKSVHVFITIGIIQNITICIVHIAYCFNRPSGVHQRGEKHGFSHFHHYLEHFKCFDYFDIL